MANDTDALKKRFIKEVHAAARARYAVEVFADMRFAPDRFTPGYFLHGMPFRRPFAAKEEAPAVPAAPRVFVQPELFEAEGGEND